MVEVSIICNTYNQEKYIREAINSFLMQKTSFEYEILIHDDASTDHTPQIIREYEKLYPNIIKPIYQVDNQYSKGIDIGFTFQYPRAKGKYLALCEGDDYWIDPNKIQKQRDALEQRKDINICACGTICIKDGKRTGAMAPSNTDCVFTPEQVIIGGGDFVGTNSIMLRKAEFLKNSFIPGQKLDYFLQIAGAIPNGLIYLSDYMSAYRVMSDGAWTKRINSDRPKMIKHMEDVIVLLNELDNVTGGVYSVAISKHIKEIEFKILLARQDFKKLRSKEYQNIYYSLKQSEKLKILIKEIVSFIRVKKE